MDLTHSLFLEEDRNITSPPQVIPGFINVNSINLPVLKTECHLQLIHLQSNGGLDTRQQQTARRDYCCVSWSSGGRTAQTDRRYQDVNRPTNGTSGAPYRQVRNLTGVKQVEPSWAGPVFPATQLLSGPTDELRKAGLWNHGIPSTAALFFHFPDQINE